MLSTWNHGIEANAAGFLALQQGGNAMDMIEAGARIVEADATGLSVGIGGLPDRDGHVTLDACCMDHTGNAGSVCFVQGVLHPLPGTQGHGGHPARDAGWGWSGAIARELGIEEVELLTDTSRRAWEEWRKTSDYKPVINIENHDTIGLLALDDQGRLAGGARPAGWRTKCTGAWATAPSSVPVCLWMPKSVAPRPRAWVKRS